MRGERDKVKVGIVGCGVVATAYYLPYLMRMDSVGLVAVCDLYETRTAACTRLFGAQEQFLDYDEMIEQADIDAVFVLTAPGTHVPFTLKAVKAGKHVLLQKPMATTNGRGTSHRQRRAPGRREGTYRAQCELTAGSRHRPPAGTD